MDRDGAGKRERGRPADKQEDAEAAERLALQRVYKSGGSLPKEKSGKIKGEEKKWGNRSVTFRSVGKKGFIYTRTLGECLRAGRLGSNGRDFTGLLF